MNAAFAKRHFGTASPIGQRVRLGGEKEAFDVWHEVVGVVGDLRHRKLDQEPGPEVYFPSTQFVLPRMHLVVRASRGRRRPRAAAPRAGRAGGLDARARGGEADDRAREKETERRAVLGGLFSALAAIGVVLAMVGLYGVVSVRRRAERPGARRSGSRSAHGESRSSGSCSARGSCLALGGVAAGVLGSLALARVLQGLLYGSRRRIRSPSWPSRCSCSRWPRSQAGSPRAGWRGSTRRRRCVRSDVAASAPSPAAMRGPTFEAGASSGPSRTRSPSSRAAPRRGARPRLPGPRRRGLPPQRPGRVRRALLRSLRLPEARSTR